MKIFVSWSREPSKSVAAELRAVLPMILGGMDVWLSDRDIEKGSRWGVQLAAQLSDTNIGIICAAANNADAPWINFEAGALSKVLDGARVHPLCLDLPKQALPATLGQFQATDFSKNDVLEMLLSINRLQEKPVRESVVQERFEKMWPHLAEALEKGRARNAEAADAASPKATSVAAVAKQRLIDQIDEGMVPLLKHLAVSGQRYTVETLAREMSLHETRVKHFLAVLGEQDFVYASYSTIAPAKYSIGEKGRELAVQEKWV